MRRSWGLLLCCFLVLGIPVGATAPTTAAVRGPDALRVDLDEVLADPRLDGAHAGVVVRDPHTDEVLYSRQGDARATPASTAKLLTSAAALETLGPDYRFRTDVRAHGPREGAVLRGDLYLRGTGDPTMRPADYERLAARVAASGIREVTGTLRTDSSWFDNVPLGSGWAWDDEPYYYAAPISALTVAPNPDFDAGNALVRVAPGQVGQPVHVELNPATSVLKVDNRATTSAPGTRPNLTAQREHGSNRVVVSGTVPAGSAPVEELTTVPEPAAYAGDVFKRALAAHGVRVEGVTPGKTPDNAATVATRESMPLSRLMVPFLKLSNNGHAEVLVKAMGRKARGEGSTAAGLDVVAEKLRGLGADPASSRMADGSGLSPLNSVPPGQLTTLLDNARSRPWFQSWYDALPVAGVSERMVGGTLRGRMRDTPAANNVHAKTGSMTGVTALSGYVTAAHGRPLVFSVVFNDFLGQPPQDLEDAIASRLAQYGGVQDQVQRGRLRIPPPRLPADDSATPVNESILECSWSKSC